MRTKKLVAVEIPEHRYVVRLDRGPRLGTIFPTGAGWVYQFDGSDREGPLCRRPEEALQVMEAVAQHIRMVDAN